MLHEIVSASYADRPSAFGFGFALLVEAQRLRKGPAIFVATQRALKDFGRPFSHGLRHLGVEPRRLVLVEARNDKDALWAMEEALRSDARPSIVMGANSANLDLTVSRRLNLAARSAGCAARDAAHGRRRGNKRCRHAVVREGGARRTQRLRCTYPRAMASDA